jgi:hypothetical protein
MRKPEVTHGAGRSADIQRIAHIHQNYTHGIEFMAYRQAVAILRQLA